MSGPYAAMLGKMRLVHPIRIERIKKHLANMPDDLLDLIEDAYGRYVDYDLEQDSD